MTDYEHSASWHRYRAVLAQRFGVTLAREPLETWQTLRGHELHVDDWRPDAGPAKGTVVLVHGGGGHGRILAPLGDFMAGLGWRVLAPDLPGYGLTRPAPHFRWDYAEWPAVVAELADQAAGPVVLMGLSVGGMTAVFAAQRAHRVAGVIATTLLDMGDPAVFVRTARWRWLGAASLLAFRFMPAIVDRLALPLRWAVPMQAMASDEQMRAYFTDDPLLGGRRVPARFFRTMHAHKFSNQELGCPLLLVHPGADAWTPTTLSLPTFERIRGPKRRRELSNGSHMPVEQPALDELRAEISGFLSSLQPNTGA